jgi:hypothetical protein
LLLPMQRYGSADVANSYLLKHPWFTGKDARRLCNTCMQDQVKSSFGVSSTPHHYRYIQPGINAGGRRTETGGSPLVL